VKNGALKKTRELALNNHLSQVKIHGRDGKIHEEQHMGRRLEGR